MDFQHAQMLIEQAMSLISKNKAHGFSCDVLTHWVRSQEALESSYELCFNAACSLLDEGRLQEAEASRWDGIERGSERRASEAQLARAKELCMEELKQAKRQSRTVDLLIWALCGVPFSSGKPERAMPSAPLRRLKKQKRMPASWRPPVKPRLLLFKPSRTWAPSVCVEN